MPSVAAQISVRGTTYALVKSESLRRGVSITELVSGFIEERLDRVEMLTERPNTPPKRKYRDVWKFPKKKKPVSEPLKKKTRSQEKFVEDFHKNRKPGPLEL